MKKTIIFVLTLAITMTTAACGTNAESQKALSSAAAQSSSTTISSEVESAIESSPLVSSEKELSGIKGSNYTDIKVSLEQRGFEVVHPQNAADSNYKVYNNSFVDTDSGIKYGCDMTINNNSEVVSASFSLENDNEIKQSEFVDASNDYLEFCSTMPYDTSDSDAIKNWVSQNISKIKDKPSKQIGDAEFQLSGTDNAIILNIGVRQDQSESGSDTFQYINKP